MFVFTDPFYWCMFNKRYDDNNITRIVGTFLRPEQKQKRVLIGQVQAFELSLLAFKIEFNVYKNQMSSVDFLHLLLFNFTIIVIVYFNHQSTCLA